MNNTENNSKSRGVFDRIYEAVRLIPKGKVATYGQIALMAGNIHWARVVGYALHKNPDPMSIPCYRVVTRDGGVSESFAFGGKNRQIELLMSEGVEFEGNKVIMSRYQWQSF